MFYQTTLDKIVATWKNLVGSGRVLLMVSGGVDSMALMETARIAGVDFRVMHVTHDMRPEAETNTDAFVVSSYCEKHGITLLREYAISSSKTETDYRNQRVQFILKAIESHGIQFVATGHHADDQVETVFMRVLRGCGVDGLRGIREVAPYPETCPVFTYVRPLLSTPKNKLVEVCRERGVPWHEDHTNDDNQITRNAIRNLVIPSLREMYPGCDAAICNLVENAREASEYIEQDVTDFIENSNESNEDGEMVFHRDELLAKGNYFLRHFLVKVYKMRRGHTGLDKLSRQRVLEFIKVLNSDRSYNKVVDLNGCKFGVTSKTIQVMW